MEKVTVDDVLLQTIVSLLNLGARKAGPRRRRPARRRREPDLEQVRQAVEGARALLPLVEPRHGEQLGPIRDALSRLQMFYAQRSGGQARRPARPRRGRAAAAGRRPGPAQSSGRLWVPGQ